MLPSFVAVPENAANFRHIILPVIIFIAVILVCLIVYLLLNYRLFSLLEREDWPALAYFLEQKIYVKGSYNVQKVRLLASTYMVISDYASVFRLENKAMLVKPSVVEKNVLIFGSARVLGKNYPEAAAFFKTYLEKGRLNAKEKEWVRWFYGFSNLLNGDFNKAEPDFSHLAQFSGDAVISGLSAYFLHNNLAKYSKKPDECKADAEKGRLRVIASVKKASQWKKEVEKMEAKIHTAIIRKYIDEAGIWLYKKNRSNL
jgi:hypothetical protein